MTKNKRTILIVLLSISLVTVTGLFYWNYITSPQYSLGQISKSFSEHDLTTFQKYVDIDGVISNLFDQQMDMVTNERKVGEGLAKDFAKGIVTLMRPQMIELLKRQTNKLIEAGNFDKTDTVNTKKEPFSLAEVWNKSGNGNNISGIREIKRDGKIATVILEISQARFDTTLLFNIKMRDKGNYWQLAEISDFKNFALTLETLENNRVDKLNQPIFEEIRKTITVSDVQIKKIPSYWGLNDKVKITMDIKNIGAKTISEYFILVGFSKDSKMFTGNKKELKNTEGVILPNKADTWSWSIDDMSYDESSNLNVETQFIIFSDGTELRPFKAWEKQETIK